MKRIVGEVVPQVEDLPTDLYTELHGLIANSRARLANSVNSELTVLYWTVDERLAQRGVLLGEDE